MKKVIISTFNNSENNYGALFQAASLSAFLRSMGYDAYNVTVKKRKGEPLPRKIKWKRKIKKLRLLSHQKEFQKRANSCRRFAAETQQQLVFSDDLALKENPPIADAYIAGSDQVFNPCNIHEDFFLDYAPRDAVRISYAASMGNERIPVEKEERFRALIGNFDALSVREDTMIPLLGKYTEKEIVQHIDPVFLTDRSDWEKLEEPYQKLRHESFILVYAIEWNNEKADQLHRIKKATGLPVVSINLGNVKNVCADQVIYDASPREFLWLLRKSSYVVASSFHGIAMSVNYQKPFWAAIGTDKATRIESLLRHYRLENRKDPEQLTAAIDYVSVQAEIQKDREKAKEYIWKQIG